jgi:DNA-nicking Smr family endonuclease
MSKVISLSAKRREKQQVTEQTQTPSPNMKPQFDPDEFFAAIMEQNRKVEERKREDRKKANKLTKRRYSIKDKD